MKISETTYLVISGCIIILVFFVIVVTIKFRNQKRGFAYRQAVLQSQLEIQKELIQRAGRELHDNIAQMASIIKIDLYTLKLSDGGNEEKVENIKQHTKQLIGDIKDLSLNLNIDRLIRHGLSKALEFEVERINRTGLLNAAFEHNGHGFALSDEKTAILYSMAQKILNSLAKEVHQSAIKIVLSANERLLSIQISSDEETIYADKKLTHIAEEEIDDLIKTAATINATCSLTRNNEKERTYIITAPIANGVK